MLDPVATLYGTDRQAAGPSNGRHRAGCLADSHDTPVMSQQTASLAEDLAQARTQQRLRPIAKVAHDLPGAPLTMDQPAAWPA